MRAVLFRKFGKPPAPPGRRFVFDSSRLVITTYVMDELRFVWAEAKNKANLKKHGVSFEEAQSAFFDEEAFGVL